MISPGQQLEALCESTQSELILVAPFIKANALENVLAHVPSSVNIQCVTRWRPDEIATGVSDLDVWIVFKQRANSTLWLRSDLHAKYYRGDHRCLVGSANLTDAALGWSKRPNLELLVSIPAMPEFEQRLLSGSIVVDDNIYEHTCKLVESIQTQPLTQFDETIFRAQYDEKEMEIAPVEAWLPMLRHPEKLFVAYVGDFEELGTGSRIAALSDLRELDIPPGLTKDAFEAYVGLQLLQKPIIHKVDQFVYFPQRFGAVRDLLKALPCSSMPDFDANRAWQTLMRWLSFFLPQRYEKSTPSHSEVFSRRLTITEDK